MHKLSLFLMLTLSLPVYPIEYIQKNLEFIPNESYDRLSFPKKNIWKIHKLLIKPITNSKNEKNHLGTITSNGKPLQLHCTNNLALWTENVLKYCLQKNGISVVAENPTLEFSGEIIDFIITGKDSLNGVILIKVYLTDKSNNSVYSETLKGEASLNCRPMENLACFTLAGDVIIDWINTFLNSPSVTGAIVNSYQNTVILHDFNYLHSNLVSNSEIPQKKPLLKKLGTLFTCVGVVPLITGLISKSKGNDEIADPLILAGSTATSAGVTTAGISFVFDIKYYTFQSKFRKKNRDIIKPVRKTENIPEELHTMFNR